MSDRPGLSLIATAIALALAIASPAGATRRSPQVPVSGTALASFFASQGQRIDVNRDQVDLQTVGLADDPRTAYHAIVFSNRAGAAFGVYDARLDAPPLYEVFPETAALHWFADVEVLAVPRRVVVNAIDRSGKQMGFRTYMEFDGAKVGIYARQSSGAVIYSQDSRNAGGARMLAFDATGSLTGSTWLAFTTSTESGGDYADAILLVNSAGSRVMDQIEWEKVQERLRHQPRDP